MPRKPRELVDGGIYHVFNRGNDKMDLFLKEGDYRFFYSLLLEIKDLFGNDIFHYCLMTNHFHLLVRIKRVEDLPRLMHRLQLNYARYFKREHSFVGHVFQERFRSPLIPQESYYLQCGRYIERNPVKAAMVRRAADYPFSSAAYYAHGRSDPLITPNLYYEGLGKTSEMRQQNYRIFLEMEEPYATVLDRALQKV